MQSSREHYHYEINPKGKTKQVMPRYCNYLISNSYRSYTRRFADLDISGMSLNLDTEGKLQLSFSVRNHYQYLYLEELLKKFNIKGNTFTSKYIYINFDLHKKKRNEIVDDIFEISKLLKTRGLTQEAVDFFYAGLMQCFSDFDNGFPGGNRFEREGYPCTKPPVEPLIHKEGKSLYQAIKDGDPKKVLNLLRLGYNPNAIHKKDNYSSLLYAISIPHSLHSSLEDKNQKLAFEKGKYEIYLKIIMLLIQYGADPDYYCRFLEKNVWDELIEIEWLENNKKNLFSKLTLDFLMKVFRLIYASPKARPSFPLHNNCQTFFANLMRQGNYFLASTRECNNTIYSLQLISSRQPQLRIKAKDDKVIIAITKKFEELVPADFKMIFELFVRNYPWQHSLTKDELPKFVFDYLLNDEKKPTFFDLLWCEGKLVGLNIATIEKININNEDIIFHRIKFALTVPTLRNYSRLMSLISFKRGFILQRQNVATRVITGFEAASQFSFLQIKELCFFPFFFKDFLVILKELYPKADLLTENDSYYILDELSYSPANQAEPFWLTPASLALKVFIEFFHQAGKSIIMAFDNNLSNFNIITKLIDPHLKDNTFANIIEQEEILMGQEINNAQKCRSKF